MKSKRGSSATASANGKTDWARVRAMKDADIALPTCQSFYCQGAVFEAASERIG